MSNFLNLSRGMSKYNGGEYDGYVIAKLEWKTTGDITSTRADILRERVGYCQIKSTGFNNNEETGFIIMTMLGGRLDAGESAGIKVSPDLRILAELTFNHEDVLRYLDVVDDTNPIHKGEGAIVPGGMVLAALQDSVSETIPWFIDTNTKFVAQFVAPIQVGETFTIAKCENGLCVYTSRQGECIKISKKN